MVGQTVSHYRIVEKLGEGGMGVVYKAEDLKLGRPVALKFLPAHLLGSEEHKGRFLHEARAAALLDHPNVCTVYEVDTVDGQTFLAMACLEGMTVQEKIAARPLPIEEALDIALQVGLGLQAAHEKGIVHRDIKPSNIMVGVHGHVTILDFGLALLSDRTKLTDSGILLGTPAYMSPEQAEGKPADRRTDIWSLGIVLYEMVSGQAPFKGESQQAVTYGILHAEPEPVTALRSGVPIELDRILAKSLAKSCEERYQHIDDLLADLKVLRKSLEGKPRRSTAQPAMKRPARPHAYWGGGALAVLVIVLGLWSVRPEGETAGPPTAGERVRIAVLPLDNLSGSAEQEYFSDGMTDALISELGAIEGLRVTSWTSVLRYKTSKPPLSQIASELGVSHVIEGAVLQSADQVRISARLIAADRDEQLWSKTFDGAVEQVLALQRDVARTVASEIGVRLNQRVQARLQAAPTANPEAYAAYLQGVQYSLQEPAKAHERFLSAVDLDPNFALARARLALSYSQGAPGTALSQQRIELGRRAAEEARKALDLDPNSEVAHNALGWVSMYFEYDWPAAERAFLRALELNPSSADACHRYSHYLMMVGRMEEGLLVSHRATELNPFDPGMVAHHVWTLYMARRYEEAVERAELILQADPSNFGARQYAYPAYAQLGRFEPILSEQSTRFTVLRDTVQAYALSGDEKRARETLAKMLPANPEEPHIGAYAIALAFAALDDREDALHWLEKAYEVRAFPLPEISIDVRLDPLREDERFLKLLAKMGLRNAWPGR
jgi:serine/threonine protein kinase/tetratricopeptide (TPR) repeat protein